MISLADLSHITHKRFFFNLDAAWLNEGRCPGGRPSVSENYLIVAKSMEILFLESNNIDQAKNAKHTNHDAVSERVQGGIGVACSSDGSSDLSHITHKRSQPAQKINMRAFGFRP